jgi:hypothetical protein
MTSALHTIYKIHGQGSAALGWTSLDATARPSGGPNSSLRRPCDNFNAILQPYEFLEGSTRLQ